MKTISDKDLLSLAYCTKVFFAEPPHPAVLSKAKACSVIGVDRFILSCRVAPSVYQQLVPRFIESFNPTITRCKRGRIRGWGKQVRLQARNEVKATELLQDSAPQTNAKIYLHLFHGQNGHYYSLQANGRFTAYEWQLFHSFIRTHFPPAQKVRLSRTELYVDLPVSIESVVVLPLGTKHRFLPEENGYYLGSRASDTSLVVYDQTPVLLYDPVLMVVPSPRTRVEFRLRDIHPMATLVPCKAMTERFGIYITDSANATMVMVDAWRAADTRARMRFLNRASPFRLIPDEDRIASALKNFETSLAADSLLKKINVKTANHCKEHAAA